MGPDETTSVLERIGELAQQIHQLLAHQATVEAKLDEITDLMTQPTEFASTREAYSVVEVAKLFGKSSYTVREWAREGRINATKRSERRGETELWSISAVEVARIKNEGLLPPDRRRNRAR